MNEPLPCASSDLPTASGIPILRVAASERSFDEVIERLAQFVVQLRQEGRPDVLLDATAATFAVPALADRARMVRRWAEAAEGRVRIAVVAPAEFIDAERFGVVMARNAGLAAEVFEQESDAREWLLEQRAADLQRKAKPASGDSHQAD